MRGFDFTLALVLSVSVAHESAFAGGSIDEGVCYGEDRDRDRGPVKTIRFKIDQGSAQISMQYSLRLTQWDVPNFLFDASGSFCDRLSKRLVRCSLDGCDPSRRSHGGMNFEFYGLPNGTVLLNSLSAVISAEGQSTLLRGTSDGPGRDISGTFLLKRLPDDECEPEVDDQRPELRIGDESPRIKAIEEQLNHLGYLLETPDDLFAPSTKSAILQFQKSYQLNPTGTASTELEELLNAVYIRDGGC